MNSSHSIFYIFGKYCPFTLFAQVKIVFSVDVCSELEFKIRKIFPGLANRNWPRILPQNAAPITIGWIFPGIHFPELEFQCTLQCVHIYCVVVIKHLLPKNKLISTQNALSYNKFKFLIFSVRPITRTGWSPLRLPSRTIIAPLKPLTKYHQLTRMLLLRWTRMAPPATLPRIRSLSTSLRLS